MHLVLSPAQVEPAMRFRLGVEFVAGGTSVGGVTQPGFGAHDMVVRFRNGAGAGTVLFSQRIQARTNWVLEFTAASVAATAGGNTVEVVRTGPSAPGVTYWIVYDYIELMQLAVPGPTLPLSVSGVPTGGDLKLHLSLQSSAAGGQRVLKLPAAIGSNWVLETSTDLQSCSAVKSAAVERENDGMRVLRPLEPDDDLRFWRIRER